MQIGLVFPFCFLPDSHSRLFFSLAQLWDNAYKSSTISKMPFNFQLWATVKSSTICAWWITNYQFWNVTFTSSIFPWLSIGRDHLRIVDDLKELFADVQRLTMRWSHDESRVSLSIWRNFWARPKKMGHNNLTAHSPLSLPERRYWMWVLHGSAPQVRHRVGTVYASYDKMLLKSGKRASSARTV